MDEDEETILARGRILSNGGEDGEVVDLEAMASRLEGSSVDVAPGVGEEEEEEETLLTSRGRAIPNVADGDGGGYEEVERSDEDDGGDRNEEDEEEEDDVERYFEVENTMEDFTVGQEANVYEALRRRLFPPHRRRRRSAWAEAVLVPHLSSDFVNALEWSLRMTVACVVATFFALYPIFSNFFGCTTATLALDDRTRCVCTLTRELNGVCVQLWRSWWPSSASSSPRPHSGVHSRLVCTLPGT
jgi:hypothetical protein